MPEQAKVRSVDVLDSFRSHLIVYLSQARATLDEVSSDALRTRLWLQNDQRSFWQAQLRRRVKDLERAQAALFSARMSVVSQEMAAEQMAVHRAKRAVEEAEAKLQMLKRWDREFDGRVQPLIKQMEKLHTILSNDMVKAVAELTRHINTLAAYAEIQAPPPPEMSFAGKTGGDAQDAEAGAPEKK